MPVQNRMNDKHIEETARTYTPWVVPNTQFARNLGAEIHRAARQKVGYRSSAQFNDMIIELRRLVRLLRQTLVPVQPRPAFVRTLEAQLIEDTFEAMVIRQKRVRLLVVGGLVGSALSVLGLLAALLLRKRNGRLHTNKPVGVV